MILAISGMSASGKTHVISNLPEMGFAMMVSHTTRPKRPGELEGFDYHYVSSEQFEKSRADALFLETDAFAGYDYGVYRSELDHALQRAPCAVHVCTPSGMSALRVEAENRCIPFSSVFIKAPIQTIVFRMIKRWSDDSSLEVKQLAKRIAFSVIVEQNWSGQFNYIVPTSDGFVDFLQELKDMASGKHKAPDPIFLNPCAPLPLLMVQLLAANIELSLREMPRPITHTDILSTAEHVSDVISHEVYSYALDSQLVSRGQEL